ncbi:helix-turn-helix domain-containing protein [Streptomyces odontomachi]|uniref:helix-turn-helix domain-containing protein n=1 Tax=Streptomyces odontomachi TaxID=2944940 RepID=UPI00210E5759|nr:helix-turn-helix transcriptional regulator [Streptomyces sp. ODS25]
MADICPEHPSCHSVHGLKIKPQRSRTACLRSETELRFRAVRPNGPAIRAIREARNMSLRALEQQTGLNRGYLSRLERGHIREPDDGPVRKVATALSVPTDAITHEEKT